MLLKIFDKSFKFTNFYLMLEVFKNYKNKRVIIFLSYPFY